MSNNDDLEFDFEGLEDDGMGEVDSESSEPKKDRKPIDDFTASAVESSKKTLLERKETYDQIEEGTETFLPGAIGEKGADTAKAVISTVHRETKALRKEVGESATPIVDYLKEQGGILEKIGIGMTKLFGIKEESSGSYGKSEDEIISDSIGSVFDEFTKSQMDLASRQTALLSTVSDKQTKEIIKATGITQELIKYSNLLQEKYYRKSLELKYKSLFELQRVSKNIEAGNTDTVNVLKHILYNTSLPDALKMRMKEAIALQMQLSLGDDFYKRLNSPEGLARLIKDRLKEKFTDVKEALRAGFEMGGMVTDTLGMADDVGQSKASMIGEMAGSAGGGYLRSWLLKLAGKKVGETALGQDMIKRVDSFLLNPYGAIMKKANSTTGITSSIYSFIGDLVRPSSLELEQTVTGLKDVNSVAEWDGRSYMTLNKVIPHLLSSQLQQLMILNGVKNPSLIQYDYTKKKFTSGHKSVKEFVDELTTQYQNNAIGYKVNKLKSIIGEDISNKDLKLLISSLMKYDQFLDIKELDNAVDTDGFLSDLEDEDRERILGYLKKIKVETTKERDEINTTFKSIKLAEIDPTKRIKRLIEDGFEEELLRIGVISWDKYNNEYVINNDKLHKLNIDLILRAVKKGDKQHISERAKRGAKTLESIKKVKESVTDKATSVYVKTRSTLMKQADELGLTELYYNSKQNIKDYYKKLERENKDKGNVIEKTINFINNRIEKAEKRREYLKSILDDPKGDERLKEDAKKELKKLEVTLKRLAFENKYYQRMKKEYEEFNANEAVKSTTEKVKTTYNKSKNYVNDIIKKYNIDDKYDTIKNRVINEVKALDKHLSQSEMYVKAKEKIENTINTINKAVSDLKQLITDPKLPNDLRDSYNKKLEELKQKREQLTNYITSGELKKDINEQYDKVKEKVSDKVSKLKSSDKVIEEKTEQTVEQVKQEETKSVVEKSKEVVEESKQVVQQVVEETKEVVEQVTEKSKEVVEESKQVVEEVKEVVQQVVDETKQVVEEVTEKTKEVVEVTEEAKKTVEKSSKVVKEVAEQQSNKITDTVKKIVEQNVIPEKIKEYKDKVVKKLEEVDEKTNITKKLKEVNEELNKEKNKLVETKNKIKEAVENVNIKDAKTVVDKVVDTVSNVAETVTEKVAESIPEAVKETTKEITEEIKETIKEEAKEEQEKKQEESKIKLPKLPEGVISRLYGKVSDENSIWHKIFPFLSPITMMSNILGSALDVYKVIGKTGKGVWNVVTSPVETVKNLFSSIVTPKEIASLVTSNGRDIQLPKQVNEFRDKITAKTKDIFGKAKLFFNGDGQVVRTAEDSTKSDTKQIEEEKEERKQEIAEAVKEGVVEATKQTMPDKEGKIETSDGKKIEDPTIKAIEETLSDPTEKSKSEKTTVFSLLKDIKENLFKKKDATDKDGDGHRDGSWQEQEANKKKQKPTEKRSIIGKAYDKATDKDSIWSKLFPFLAPITMMVTLFKKALGVYQGIWKAVKGIWNIGKWSGKAVKGIWDFITDFQKFKSFGKFLNTKLLTPLLAGVAKIAESITDGSILDMITDSFGKGKNKLKSWGKKAADWFNYAKRKASVLGRKYFSKRGIKKLAKSTVKSMYKAPGLLKLGGVVGAGVLVSTTDTKVSDMIPSLSDLLYVPILSDIVEYGGKKLADVTKPVIDNIFGSDEESDEDRPKIPFYIDSEAVYTIARSDMDIKHKLVNIIDILTIQSQNEQIVLNKLFNDPVISPITYEYIHQTIQTDDPKYVKKATEEIVTYLKYIIKKYFRKNKEKRDEYFNYYSTPQPIQIPKKEEPKVPQKPTKEVVQEAIESTIPKTTKPNLTIDTKKEIEESDKLILDKTVVNATLAPVINVEDTRTTKQSEEVDTSDIQRVKSSTTTLFKYVENRANFLRDPEVRKELKEKGIKEVPYLGTLYKIDEVAENIKNKEYDKANLNLLSSVMTLIPLLGTAAMGSNVNVNVTGGNSGGNTTTSTSTTSTNTSTSTSSTKSAEEGIKKSANTIRNKNIITYLDKKGNPSTQILLLKDNSLRKRYITKDGKWSKWEDMDYLELKVNKDGKPIDKEAKEQYQIYTQIAKDFGLPEETFIKNKIYVNDMTKKGAKATVTNKFVSKMKFNSATGKFEKNPDWKPSTKKEWHKPSNPLLGYNQYEYDETYGYGLGYKLSKEAENDITLDKVAMSREKLMLLKGSKNPLPDISDVKMSRGILSYLKGTREELPDDSDVATNTLNVKDKKSLLKLVLFLKKNGVKQGLALSMASKIIKNIKTINTIPIDWGNANLQEIFTNYGNNIAEMAKLSELERIALLEMDNKFTKTLSKENPYESVRKRTYKQKSIWKQKSSIGGISDIEKATKTILKDNNLDKTKKALKEYKDSAIKLINLYLAESNSISSTLAETIYDVFSVSDDGNMKPYKEFRSSLKRYKTELLSKVTEEKDRKLLIKTFKHYKISVEGILETPSETTDAIMSMVNNSNESINVSDYKHTASTAITADMIGKKESSSSVSTYTPKTETTTSSIPTTTSSSCSGGSCSSSVISSSKSSSSKSSVSPATTTASNVIKNKKGIPDSKIPDDVKAFKIALGKVESNNNYFAKPNPWGYEGKYQFRFRAGDDGLKYLRKMGITVEQWRRSPELQEQHMNLVIKDYDKDLRRKGLPVNNWTRWLRHNQGLGGAYAIYHRNLGYGGASLRATIRRNIINQFPSKDKGKMRSWSDDALIDAYIKRFKHRFTDGNVAATSSTGNGNASTTSKTPTSTATSSSSTTPSSSSSGSSSGKSSTSGGLVGALKGAIKAALEFFGLGGSEDNADPKKEFDVPSTIAEPATASVNSGIGNNLDLSSIPERDRIKIAKVKPQAANFYIAFYQYAKSKGVEPMVASGLRTQKEQQALYAKGRTAPGSIVTHKDGVTKKSKHQLGIALDIISAKGWKDKAGTRRVAELMREFAKLHPEYQAHFITPVDGWDANHVQFPLNGGVTKSVSGTSSVPKDNKTTATTTSSTTGTSTTSTNTTSNVSVTTPTSSGCSGGSCSSTLSSLSNSVTGSSATPLKPKVATSSTSTSYPDIPGTSTTTDRAMGSSGYAMASNNISIDNEPLTKEAIERNKILKEIHQTLASMDSKLDKQDTPHKEYVASNEKEKNIDVNRRYQDIRDDSPMNLDVYDIV